jgi:oligoribonuclease NrnB/cAMP/cGMP phosphodiesterase (DHH superfamily)
MNFLIGQEKSFWNFVDSINKEDKIAIITHTDLDGIASCVFLEEILKSKNLAADCIKFISYEKGMFDKLFEKFNKNKITKVFLTDMNADVSDPEGFELLRENFDCFLIDHHPTNQKAGGIENILKSPSHDCSAWVLYNFLKKLKDVSYLDWLVCAAMVSDWSFNDKDNLAFIESKYPGTVSNIDSSEPKKISDMIGSALVYFDNLPKVFELVKNKKLKEFEKAYEIIEFELKSYVEKFNKEAECYPKKNLFFAYFKMKYYMASILSTVLSQQDVDKTYVFVTDAKDKKGFLKVSVRNQSGDEDVNELMKRACVGLEDSSAGGHKKAAAASIRKKDLERFKRNMLS